MLKLVRIAVGRCAALIMIDFVEVDAFGDNFILVDVTVVGPFRNILSRTFDATAGELGQSKMYFDIIADEYFTDTADCSQFLKKFL
nr:hypothetical protein CFP56_37461 [Quercus suber]